MKRSVLIGILALLAAAPAGCSLSAGIEAPQGMATYTGGLTQPVMTPTESVGTPNEAATLPVSMPIGVSTLSIGMLTEIATMPVTVTYTNLVAGYQFDYPAEWFVSGDDASVVALTSFETSGSDSGAIPQGSTKIDFISWGDDGLPPITLDELMAYVDQERERAQEGTIIIQEGRWALVGGIPAVRRIYQSATLAGRVMALYTVIDGQPLRMIGYGDLTRFDAIALTVRPVTAAPAAHGLDATYVESSMDYAFDYPSTWYVYQNGPIVLGSIPFDFSGDGDIPAGEVKIDFHIVPLTTLESIVTEIRRSAEINSFQIVREDFLTLPSGLEAVRYEFDGGWSPVALYTVVNGSGLNALGFGDVTRFDAIVMTLRALPPE